jgi:hypothetical protein
VISVLGFRSNKGDDLHGNLVRAGGKRSQGTGAESRTNGTKDPRLSLLVWWRGLAETFIVEYHL